MSRREKQSIGDLISMVQAMQAHSSADNRRIHGSIMAEMGCLTPAGQLQGIEMLVDTLLTERLASEQTRATLIQAQDDYGELQNTLDVTETERNALREQCKQAQEELLRLQSSARLSTEQVNTITDIAALRTAFATLHGRCEAAEAERTDLLRTLSQQHARYLSPTRTVAPMQHMSVRCPLFTGIRRPGHHPDFATWLKTFELHTRGASDLLLTNRDLWHALYGNTTWT